MFQLSLYSDPCNDDYSPSTHIIGEYKTRKEAEIEGCWAVQEGEYGYASPSVEPELQHITTADIQQDWINWYWLKVLAS